MCPQQGIQKVACLTACKLSCHTGIVHDNRNLWPIFCILSPQCWVRTQYTRQRFCIIWVHENCDCDIYLVYCCGVKYRQDCSIHTGNPFTYCHFFEISCYTQVTAQDDFSHCWCVNLSQEEYSLSALRWGSVMIMSVERNRTHCSARDCQTQACLHMTTHKVQLSRICIGKTRSRTICHSDQEKNSWWGKHHNAGVFCTLTKLCDWEVCLIMISTTNCSLTHQMQGAIHILADTAFHSTNICTTLHCLSWSLSNIGSCKNLSTIVGQITRTECIGKVSWNGCSEPTVITFKSTYLSKNIE